MACLITMLRRNATDRGGQDALLVKRAGAFEPIGWAEIARDVVRMAAALRKLGVGRSDRVAQVAENRYEWIVADLAILLLRGVHVPIHVALSAEQIAYQITHSEARVVLIADAAQAARLAPHCAHQGVTFVTYAHRAERGVLTLDELLAETETPETIDWDAFPLPEADELATIMYTSGTSGAPKGVMLSHGNLASNAIATANAYTAHEDDLRLCFLPLSHIYARTCDLYVWLVRGTRLALAESRETILADCAALRPTSLNGVPYFYEKVFRGLQQHGKQEEPGALQALFGGRVRTCFSGGAALPEHVEAFFARQALPLRQGYGLSEASPVITVSAVNDWRVGSVGRPIAGVEVRIAEDGEILTRGPHVMLGYWKDEAATQEAIRDGWLHTGDVGQLDEQGMLRITGRKKELIVLSSGKKVAPAHLENLLLASPLVMQAMVLGDGRKFLTALIVPNPDRLRAEIRARRILVFSRRRALQNRRVLEIYRQEIDRLLAGLARHEQIVRFALLDRGFTPESGELTAKASLRRDVILDNWAPRIEALYDA